jgi:hypothetical protein
MPTARVFAPTDPLQSTLLLPWAPEQPNYVPQGHTEHFHCYYKRTLGAHGAAICNTLQNGCERDFARLTSIFGTSPPGFPFHVYVTDDIAGALHYGCSNTEIYVGLSPTLAPMADTYCLLLAAELVEAFEAAINAGWNCAFSPGEGLSRALACALHPGAQTPELVTAPVWLDKTPPVGGDRFNWVDDLDPQDSNPFAIGCAVLFLNWMNAKLGIPWDQISRAGGENLEDTYASIFGDRQGWRNFKAEIDAQFPPGHPSGLKTDNPFSTIRLLRSVAVGPSPRLER